MEDGATGTLYFRFRTTDFAGHLNFGLSDVSEPTGEWNHFEAQIRDNQEGGLDFRDADLFTNVLEDLPLDEWVSVWMVINNADDFTQSYIQTETTIPDQTQLTAGDQDEFLFRFGTDEPLINFFMRSGPNHFEEWFLDDIYLDLDGENLSVPSPADLIGDFDASGQLDLPDVNLLNAEIIAGTHTPSFDVTGDSLVNNDDLQVWVKDLRKTWFGDANLDGEFTSGDLVSVFTVGRYETGTPAGWEEGDWNADGIFSSADFVGAFSDGGYEQGPVAAVPEPTSGIVGFALGMIWLVRKRLA